MQTDRWNASQMQQAKGQVIPIAVHSQDRATGRNCQKTHAPHAPYHTKAEVGATHALPTFLECCTFVLLKTWCSPTFFEGTLSGLHTVGLTYSKAWLAQTLYDV